MSAELEALRRELAYAQSAKPGGQPPNPGRVRLIEAEIARLEGTTEPEATEAETGVGDEFEMTAAVPATEKAVSGRPKK